MKAVNGVIELELKCSHSDPEKEKKAKEVLAVLCNDRTYILKKEDSLVPHVEKELRVSKMPFKVFHDSDEVIVALYGSPYWDRNEVERDIA